MAFQTKYLVEFQDYLKLQWKIEFQTNPWAGAVTSLTATGDPLKIEFLSDSDEFNEPIRPSKTIINVYSITDFALLDFYTDQDFRIKCNIYCGTNLYWTGFVVTGEYTEPYDCVPYPVQITCVDGLNYLKNILYDDGATPPVYYNGRTLESQIIIDILAKIQVPETAGDPIFTEYVNVYETAMAATVDDSPMDQLKIDVDIFQDMYCYEVLSELLKKYNAVIRQVEGYIVIYRPTELAESYVYGRIFTDATTKSSTAFLAEQFISRAAGITNIKQVPGSALMTKTPAKKITLNQDYGYKESWIDNWEFTAETFDDPVFKFWTNEVGAITKHITNFLVDEKNGVAISWDGTGVSPGITQVFGVGSIVTTTDNFVISLDFNWYNDTVAAVSATNISIMVKQGSYYLKIKNDTKAEWTLTPSLIVDVTPLNLYGSTNIPVAWGNGWVSFVREFSGLPGSGDISIHIASQLQTDVYNCVKNIHFYASSYELLQKSRVSSGRERFSNLSSKWNIKYKTLGIITERQYIVTNALNGKNLIFDYLLGDVTDANIDNVMEQLAGSLATWVSSAIAFSSVWNTRTPGGEADPLLEITGGEIGHQYSRPKQLIQFALIETDAADRVLNILGHIQDSLNQVSGDNRKFVFISGELDVKKRSWNADFIEIIK